MTARVAGVILAAGASCRLGTPKQTLTLGGQPVLTYALEAARNAALDPILVVLGHRSDEIQRQLDLSGTHVVHNPEYRTGLSSSVRAGVRALPADVGAAIFLLGDQPSVDPGVIERLIAAFRDGGSTVVQPRYAEGRGNPVLIARDLFPALLQLTGDTGARPLLEQHRDQIELVDATDYHRPDDIDTWEDYERLRAGFALP